MKKVLSIIIAVILIISCFAVTCFAGIEANSSIEVDSDNMFYGDIYLDEKTTASIDEDFEVLTVNGKKYVPVNVSDFPMDFYTIEMKNDIDSTTIIGYYPMDFRLSEAQKEKISAVSMACNDTYSVYLVDLHFKNGSTYSQSFMRESLIPEYEKLLKNEGEYVIDYWYPEDNQVYADKATLVISETITINTGEIDYIDFFDVHIQTSGGELVKNVGVLITNSEDKFYYADSEENGKTGDWYSNFDWSPTDIKVHEITDPVLYEQLVAAQKAYYDDDYGLLYNSASSETVGKVLLIVFFLIVPIAVLVIFTIKAIKGKGAYRMLYIAISVGALVELIIFVISALMLK